MSQRVTFGGIAMLLAGVAGAWFYWHQSGNSEEAQLAAPLAASAAVTAPAAAATEGENIEVELATPRECGLDAPRLAGPQEISLAQEAGTAVVSICLNEAQEDHAPPGTHTLDVRTLDGRSLQTLVLDLSFSSVPDNIDRFHFMDLDQDGFLDLLVATSVAGGGPFLAHDVYRFDPANSKFLPDRYLDGISSPKLAKTPGCLVTEMKSGKDGYFGTRYCLDQGSGKWEQEDGCRTDGDGAEACHAKLER